MMCLINGGLCKIIFDLVSVEFIDSYGIGTIVEIAKYIRQHHNGDVVLINVSERILLIFKPINSRSLSKYFIQRTKPCIIFNTFNHYKIQVVYYEF